MTSISVQPDSLRLVEEKYDTLELIDLSDHLVMIQVSEDGESETLVIGPQQAKALLQVLQQFTKEA